MCVYVCFLRYIVLQTTFSSVYFLHKTIGHETKEILTSISNKSSNYIGTHLLAFSDGDIDKCRNDDGIKAEKVII